MYVTDVTVTETVPSDIVASNTDKMSMLGFYAGVVCKSHSQDEKAILKHLCKRT